MATLPSFQPPQQTLAVELAHVARLHAERIANPILAGALERVARWQSKRLRAAYSDLAAQKRYALAIDFFEEDLYGGADFAQRDADLARVVPLMARMLPAGVIGAVAKAVELNALSQELDRSLLARLPRADGQFSVGEYCRAYQRMGKRTERERQIRLIGEIGAALDHYVEKPFLLLTLTMMRQPARLAGLGALQHFLERGVGAFRQMHGAKDFLAIVTTRETELMESILAGNTAPFANPMQPMGDAASARAAAGS